MLTMNWERMALAAARYAPKAEPRAWQGKAEYVAALGNVTVTVFASDAAEALGKIVAIKLEYGL